MPFKTAFLIKPFLKNSADLGGFYLPRPSASVDNTLLDLQDSSYPMEPHLITANYFADFQLGCNKVRLDNFHMRYACDMNATCM